MRRIVALLVLLALAGAVPATADAASAKGKRRVACAHKAKRLKVPRRARAAAVRRCVTRRRHATRRVPAPAPLSLPRGPEPMPARPAPVAAPAPAPAPAALPVSEPVAEPGPPAPTEPAQALPRRVQAVSREFSLTLSRPAVAAGLVTVEFNNAFAEDPHDLNVAPEGGGKVVALGTLTAGKVATSRVELAAGRYTLYCSLPGHEQLGMRATLSVE
ncbi:MAG TPA: hypothetical protein VF533_17985 [Solirubrobacteraceae bacterium]|jgi:plastocyanin